MNRPEWKLRSTKVLPQQVGSGHLPLLQEAGTGSRAGTAQPTHGYLEMTASAGSKASRVEGRWGILNKLGRWVEMWRFWGWMGPGREDAVSQWSLPTGLLRRRERGKRK